MNWKVKVVIFPLIAYILTFIIGVSSYGLGLLNNIGKIDDSNNSFITETFEVDTDKADTIKDDDIKFGNTKVLENENVINILLVGQDNKGEEQGRSDTMILLSLNREKNQISMTSFMRDMYVQIPGYSNNKLNSAYQFGGYDLLNQTIEENFGITIHYNVGVNFDTFEKVIEKLGGIDIKLTQDEAEYIMKKTKKDTGLKEGVNHLSGKEALWYARTRYVSTGTEANDFGRTSRQRVMIQKVYQEITKLNITDIIDIAYDIIEDIETDMSMTEIIALGTEVYNLNLDEIETHRLPHADEYSDETINGMSVLIVDFQQAHSHLEEWLYNTEN